MLERMREGRSGLGIWEQVREEIGAEIEGNYRNRVMMFEE